MNPLTYSNNIGSMVTPIKTGGGIDNDIECKESDFIFLSEVIQNVKSTYDST